MQKIITSGLKNIKRYLTGEEKIVTLSLLVITSIFGLLVSTPSYAENISASANIHPSMTFSIPVSTISMNLNQASKPFDSQTIPITVGTNNNYGYQVFVTTSDNTTDLVNTEDNTKVISTLSTAGSYDATSFPANSWGYKLGTGDYTPFTSGAVIASASGPVNEETTNMTLSAKIDYLQDNGTYETKLNFAIIPTVYTNFMQELELSECPDSPMVVQDERDGKTYRVRKLADGNCWMIDNLRFTGTELSSATSNVAARYTDENPYKINNGNGWSNLTSNPVSSDASMTSGVDDNNNPTVWYNYAGASAGTIVDSSSSDIQVYDICPSGWRLPTGSEFNNILSYNVQFNPTAGGYYSSGSLKDSNYGRWWGSTVVDATYRYNLYFYNNNLFANTGGRGVGIYVRCILDTKTIADVTYMQDVTPAISRNTAIGATTTLKDSRDGQDYTIAKLADGNLWLLENLRLDISDPAVQANLTSATTNATDATLGYLKNGGGSSPYPANGVIAKTASSGSWTNDYANPYIATEYKNTIQPASGSSPAGKIGIYYNFCAASAGSYCYASGAGSGDASQDICPAGWRLPTDGASGEYQALYTAYSSNVANALSTPLSGNFVSGTADNQGTSGYFWSSTRYNGNSMYFLYVNSSTVYPQSHYNRYNGFSVRCIAK